MNSAKMTDFLLTSVPQKHWNLLSNVLARFSLPTIGSPISFTCGRFRLREIDLLSADKPTLDKFIGFCYPDEESREREVALDRQYWRHATTFVISDSEDEIAGCVQFIEKTGTNRLPVEFAHVVGDSRKAGGGEGSRHLPVGKSSEVYRCRRADKLSGAESLMVVSMLFKATWAKVIETNTAYSYITFDAENRQLSNMYSRKLLFENPGIEVRFGSDSKQWRLLYSDWRKLENSYATTSRSHFMLTTFFRTGLRRKNLAITEPPPPSSSIHLTEKPVLLANGRSVRPTLRHTRRARKNSILANASR